MYKGYSTIPKELGGWGVKNPELFCRALAAKYLWRLVQNTDTLWGRVLCFKYCLDTTLVEWFRNPIPAPNAFEEGNMANIFPTIKVKILTKLDIVEEIRLGKSCSPEEITSYKALFQEFRDIFAWSCTEITSLHPFIVEHHIDTWPDGAPVHQKQ